MLNPKYAIENIKKALMLRCIEKREFKILNDVIFSNVDVYRHTFGKEGFNFKKKLMRQRIR